MKTKVRVMIAFIAVVMVSFTGYNVYKAQVSKHLSNIALANIEALAGSGEGNFITNWWDSKVYDCQSVSTWEYKCMRYGDIPRDPESWEVSTGNFSDDEIVCGYFKDFGTDCVGGNTVAHCRDCN